MKFSAVANSTNEGGILSGAWYGEWNDDDGNLIDGCTKPQSWSGSVRGSKQFGLKSPDSYPDWIFDPGESKLSNSS